ncbi:MAG: azurin [Neisseria sp.]|nr:azurin [Neisseria sp.]
MKTYLALISAAALALTACSQEAPQPPKETPPPAASAETAPPPAPADSPASGTPAPASAPPAAQTADACEVLVDSDDQMQFNTKEIVIDKACKEVKITLKHTGSMPASAMGHNIVISKAEDTKGVLSDGAAAGEKNDYVKPGDPRVIAHTKLIGGGETTSVTVDTAKFAADGKYEFYCSFPAHSSQMLGYIKLK